MPRKKPAGPDPIDVHVGARVRARRKMIGLSQTQLGKDLGITFQQVQKCERGANRIGSSRLFRIAAALDVPVTYFFEGVEEKLSSISSAHQYAPVDAADPGETAELVTAYYAITDPRIRQKVLGLARLFASSEPA